MSIDSIAAELASSSMKKEDVTKLLTELSLTIPAIRRALDIYKPRRDKRGTLHTVDANFLQWVNNYQTLTKKFITNSELTHDLKSICQFLCGFVTTLRSLVRATNLKSFDFTPFAKNIDAIIAPYAVNMSQETKITLAKWDDIKNLLSPSSYALLKEIISKTQTEFKLFYRLNYKYQDDIKIFFSTHKANMKAGKLSLDSFLTSLIQKLIEIKTVAQESLEFSLNKPLLANAAIDLAIRTERFSLLLLVDIIAMYASQQKQFAPLMGRIIPVLDQLELLRENPFNPIVVPAWAFAMYDKSIEERTLAISPAAVSQEYNKVCQEVYKKLSELPITATTKEQIDSMLKDNCLISENHMVQLYSNLETKLLQAEAAPKPSGIIFNTSNNEPPVAEEFTAVGGKRPAF
jgi:hypothetical protein